MLRFAGCVASICMVCYMYSEVRCYALREVHIVFLVCLVVAFHRRMFAVCAVIVHGGLCNTNVVIDFFNKALQWGLPAVAYSNGQYGGCLGIESVSLLLLFLLSSHHIMWIFTLN